MQRQINRQKETLSGWRLKTHEIIYEAETPEGKYFDLLLIACIIGSLFCVVLESVESIATQYGPLLLALEKAFTVLFTIEYLLRLWSVVRPLRYATSFFGVIDLLAVLPSYLSSFIPGTRYFLVIRSLRLLRVFRVLKLARYMDEGHLLMHALTASRVKISVFFFTVLNLVVIIASLMYVVEGAENGFTSIPTSMYWTVVTLTTVGYGDISPQTPLGKGLAMVVMMLGYSIIAVPTGIVTAEIALASSAKRPTRHCPSCSTNDHLPGARFCSHCGALLQP